MLSEAPQSLSIHRPSPLHHRPPPTLDCSPPLLQLHKTKWTIIASQSRLCRPPTETSTSHRLSACQAEKSGHKVSPTYLTCPSIFRVEGVYSHVAAGNNHHILIAEQGPEPSTPAPEGEGQGRYGGRSSFTQSMLFWSKTGKAMTSRDNPQSHCGQQRFPSSLARYRYLLCFQEPSGEWGTSPCTSLAADAPGWWSSPPPKEKHHMI